MSAFELLIPKLVSRLNLWAHTYNTVTAALSLLRLNLLKGLPHAGTKIGNFQIKGIPQNLTEFISLAAGSLAPHIVVHITPNLRHHPTSASFPRLATQVANLKVITKTNQNI